MTREDAIKRLKEYAQYSYGIWHNDEEDTKAFDMAIEALSKPIVDITQRDLCADISCTDCPFMKETCKLMDYVAYADRTCGVWEYTEITTDNDTYLEWVCSECGGSGYELMDFCPWCGADMRKETE